MGIFNGNSIYNDGGAGGGGYADGGELVDADFIKVENNTLSKYNNISRNLINFYFEDEGILNALIEVSTLVNSTVNIYKKINNSYYPLSIIGSSNINSNENYLITVSGNYFKVENGTPKDEFIENINGQYIKCKKIGSLYWTVEDYGTWWTVADAINFVPVNGWRIPNNDDFFNLKDYLDPNAGYKIKTDYGWNDGGNGDNSSGFNAYPYGYVETPGDQNVGVGDFVRYRTSLPNGRYFGVNKGSTNIDYYQDPYNKNRVRLCKDA